MLWLCKGGINTKKSLSKCTVVMGPLCREVNLDSCGGSCFCALLGYVNHGLNATPVGTKRPHALGRLE
jgi:hypothetical protein